ncbi:cyclase family protein [Nocardiopsis sp. LOL_012]|uniref:cyclase family protein n=1 Tax=Nocardiopsis sp. LOL_012 TaxID=3345409 RepID=UPI003A8999FD
MTDPLLAAVRGGVRTIDLAQPLFTGMPSSPNHPGFRMTLIRRHGDMVRPDGGSAANELIITGGHVGTHVDALSHVSHEGCLHGGIDAAEATVNGRFAHHGIDRMEPLVRRGVLLDVAAAHGVECLDPGYGVSAADLDRAAAHGGAEPGPGDVALVRTGWATRFHDAPAYLGQEDGVPGPTEEAGRWLAERGIAAAGADTTAFEQIPAGKGHSVLPVHRLLLVEHGIHIIEHMRLEDLAREGAGEFVFVLSPLKIVGGTGSPVRPLAVVSA